MIQYIVDGKCVRPIVDIGNGAAVHASEVFSIKDKHLFGTKKDALYAKLINELAEGKSIFNFKSSPYYKYYIERLKQQNPEFIL